MQTNPAVEQNKNIKRSESPEEEDDLFSVGDSLEEKKQTI